MLRALFFALVVLALIGDARVFLFVLNRWVFGSHREEKSPWTWLIWVTPPVLLGLTLLFWPLNQWINWMLEQDFVDRLTPERLDNLIWQVALGKIGLFWLFIAASIGIYWIVDRARINLQGPQKLRGVRSLPPEVIRIRRAHMPFAVLRNLGAHNDVYDIEVTRHVIFIDDLPEAFDGYRISFLTDTHVARLLRRKFFESVVEQSNRFEPDLVLLGGDFVSFQRHIPLMADVLLTDLRARDGVFAVLGNHDYWANGDKVRAAMEEKGVRFIINSSTRLRRDGAELSLVGIDEVYRGEPDIPKAFAGVGPGPCLGVTHHPDLIDDLDGRRLDLLVCGHTHGGQIRFPFFGSVVVPSRHEARYAAGFQRVGGVLMYVSRGVGAIPPLRILCRPEVATFVLRQGGRSK
ncbi:MAG TPA: metallophosphoesterase [Thermoanaerobaculia bacterium]|nr:metallophosphoesterase [Thermoanaerobaculia bacterium]